MSELLDKMMSSNQAPDQPSVSSEELFAQFELITNGVNDVINRVNEQDKFLNAWAPKFPLFEIMFQHLYANDSTFKDKLTQLLTEIEAKQAGNKPKNDQEPLQ